MKRLLFLLLLPALAQAIPTCPAYPYHDFTWASSYAPPVRPADSLIDNCENLDLVDNTICDHLGNLTDEQKKVLITDNLIRNNGFPDFNESKNWNYALQFTKYAPDNTTIVNSNNIKGAWVRILSLSPSVVENSSLFVNSTGELYSQAALSFVIEKQTFPSDCNTQYVVCGYNFGIQNYLNGQPIGTGTKSNFSVSQVPNVFASTLNANSQYLIHHSQLITHCYTSNGVTYCYTSCDYIGTDDIHDSASASDSKSASYYAFNHTEKSMVDSFKDNLLDGWFSYSSNADFSNFGLSVGNSFLKVKNREYDLAYGLAPYNILTPAAHPNRKAQIYNIVPLSREINETTIYSEKTHFQVGTASLNCTFEVNSHFGSWQNGTFCLELNQTPIIALNLTNGTNSTFQLEVKFYDNVTSSPLAQKQITLYYAGKNQSITTDSLGEAYAQFNYTPATSTVYAEFLTDFETKSARAIYIIPTKEPDFFSALWYIATALLIAYLLYRLARRLLK